jgi:hypothetical protein
MRDSINSVKEPRRPLKIANPTHLHTHHLLVEPHHLLVEPHHLLVEPQPHLMEPQQKPIQLISLVRPIIKIGVKQDNMFAKLPIELIKSTFYVQ